MTDDARDLVLGGTLGEHPPGLALLRRGEHRLTAADPAAPTGGVEPGPGAFLDDVALDYVDKLNRARRLGNSAVQPAHLDIDGLISLRVSACRRCRHGSDGDLCAQFGVAARRRS